MTEQQIKEMIKSFAYGASVLEVAEVEGISTEEAEAFRITYALEIENKKKDIEGGDFDE